jgi:hypothetical protein
MSDRTGGMFVVFGFLAGLVVIFLLGVFQGHHDGAQQANQVCEQRVCALKVCDAGKPSIMLDGRCACVQELPK